MTRDIKLYISDIIENMHEAVAFVGEMTFQECSADRKTVYAVIRCFEIIGEATKNVPDEIREKHKSIPWKDMARMRDKCIHMYWGVNHKIVWTAIKEELPTLIPQIESLLAELQNQQKK